MADTKCGRRLERVARGVAVVEDRARPAVALVLGHDQRLGGDASKHNAFEHPRVPLDQARTISLQQVEQASVHGDGVLYNLRKGVPIVRDWQRLDGGQVGDHCRRLPEGADCVLRAHAVDARLAADARIHHGEQRRGHRDQPDATLPDRGRQAGQVADGASPHRDDASPAVDVLPLEERKHCFQLGHGFGTFTRRDGVDRGLQASSFDRLRNLQGVRPHIGVGHDRRAGRVEARDDVAQVTLEVGADQDGVATRARVEDQADHSFITCSATSPAGRLPSTRCVACS